MIPFRLETLNHLDTGPEALGAYERPVIAVIEWLDLTELRNGVVSNSLMAQS